jgi:hypothetical protein
MPLVGGSGAGNPVGGNPAGTGTNLNYIGNHAYAYSGTVEITGTTNAVTMLDFSTGPQYIRAIFQFHSIESGGNDINFRVIMDSQVIATQSINSAKEFYHAPLELIIPPYTRVICDGLNIDASTGRDSTATVAGRVYA